jgi:dihydrofolate reductase
VGYPREEALVEFMSIDVVTQGPGSPEEDRSDGSTPAVGWSRTLDDAFIEAVVDWVGNAEAFLFGRRTYESFARDWPQADADDPFAPIMNGLPRYVASRSPLAADWDATSTAALHSTGPTERSA